MARRLQTLIRVPGGQVNLVGPPGGKATFTSGGGVLNYSALTTLKVASKPCPGYFAGPTGETSNAVYGDILPASGSDLSQTVGF